MSATELAEVVELAETEALGQEYGEVHVVHVLLGLLAAEGDPALKSARASVSRVRFAAPAHVNGRRLPWSAAAQALIDSSGSRRALRARLRARGPLLVQQVLDDLEAVADGR